MPSGKQGQGESGRSAGSLVIGVVVVLLMLGGLIRAGLTKAWVVVPEILGLATFLEGVVGLMDFAWVRRERDLAGATGYLALILAGGMLAGGGWGAALGLALLGIAALWVAHRRERDSGTPAGD